MTSVQLLGMKHTGKSTLGRLLSKKTSLPFGDLDQLLEAEPDAAGLSAREIFRTFGKARFQELEARAARKAADRMRRSPSILAWGGGTVDNDAAVDALRGQGTLVHLVESPEVLFERILRGGLPAFLSADRPWEDFQALYGRRMQGMDEICDVRIELAGRSVEEALRALIDALNA